MQELVNKTQYFHERILLHELCYIIAFVRMVMRFNSWDIQISIRVAMRQMEEAQQVDASS